MVNKEEKNVYTDKVMMTMITTIMTTTMIVLRLGKKCKSTNFLIIHNM